MDDQCIVEGDGVLEGVLIIDQPFYTNSETLFGREVSRKDIVAELRKKDERIDYLKKVLAKRAEKIRGAEKIVLSDPKIGITPTAMQPGSHALVSFQGFQAIKPYEGESNIAIRYTKDLGLSSFVRGLTNLVGVDIFVSEVLDAWREGLDKLILANADYRGSGLTRPPFLFDFRSRTVFRDHFAAKVLESGERFEDKNRVKIKGIVPGLIGCYRTTGVIIDENAIQTDLEDRNFRYFLVVSYLN